MIRQVRREDYVYCPAHDVFLDLWRFPDLEDTGHADCNWRHVREAEMWECVHDCREHGCFHEDERRRQLEYELDTLKLREIENEEEECEEVDVKTMLRCLDYLKGLRWIGYFRPEELVEQAVRDFMSERLDCYELAEVRLKPVQITIPVRPYEFEDSMGRPPRDQEEFDTWARIVESCILEGQVDWKLAFNDAADEMPDEDSSSRYIREMRERLRKCLTTQQREAVLDKIYRDGFDDGYATGREERE